MILITGAHKAFALYKAIEEGVNHMLVSKNYSNSYLRMTHYLKIFQRWTVSAFQQHPSCLFVCDEDATLELRVKTVKYFKVIDRFIYLNFIINGDGSAL